MEWELIAKGNVFPLKWTGTRELWRGSERERVRGFAPIGSNFANFAELRKTTGERVPFSLVTRPLDNDIDIDAVAIARHRSCNPFVHLAFLTSATNKTLFREEVEGERTSCVYGEANDRKRVTFRDSTRRN